MKIIRFIDPSGVERFGNPLENDRAEVCSPEDLTPTGEIVEVTQCLVPVIPTQIIAIGLNYKQHAAEVGAKHLPEEPIVFFKGLNTLLNPGETICLPRHLRSDEVDYECELAVYIGKEAKNVSRENALEYVAGYTCANDVSARDWQRKGGKQWGRSKSFDTFCPLGPVLVTPDDITDPNSLGIQTILNGEVVQSSNTSDMIFDVPTLIEFLSGSSTLLPGTVILTGTPQGVGMAKNPPRFLQPGDTVTIQIERIGSLTNPVQEECELPLR